MWIIVGINLVAMAIYFFLHRKNQLSYAKLVKLIKYESKVIADVKNPNCELKWAALHSDSRSIENFANPNKKMQLYSVNDMPYNLFRIAKPYKEVIKLAWEKEVQEFRDDSLSHSLLNMIHIPVIMEEREGRRLSCNKQIGMVDYDYLKNEFIKLFKQHEKETGENLLLKMELNDLISAPSLIYGIEDPPQEYVDLVINEMVRLKNRHYRQLPLFTKRCKEDCPQKYQEYIRLFDERRKQA